MEAGIGWPGGRPMLYADVAVVGYGPVGQLLTLLLGRSGKRVVVVERQPRAYPLPRAVHFDDEVGRIFQSVGAPPDSLPDVVAPYDDLYEWRAADRQPLLRLDWRGLGPSGWHVSNFFHQPGLEAVLDARVQALEGVQVLRGWNAVAHVEEADGIAVELGRPGPVHAARARSSPGRAAARRPAGRAHRVLDARARRPARTPRRAPHRETEGEILISVFLSTSAGP